MVSDAQSLLVHVEPRIAQVALADVQAVTEEAPLYIPTSLAIHSIPDGPWPANGAFHGGQVIYAVFIKVVRDVVAGRANLLLHVQHKSILAPTASVFAFIGLAVAHSFRCLFAFLFRI